MSIKLPVKALRAIIDPFRECPWNCRLIKEFEVHKAIAEKRFCRRRHLVSMTSKGLTRKEHTERIAYLTIHKSSHPIELDVGVPALGNFCNHPLQDGHHRLAAAILRKDEFISAEISGQISYATRLFGVECDERVLRY